MNKRITSFAICLVLVVAMLVSAVPAFAAGSSCTYYVEADKTVANPGDTITFTVSMQQTGKLNTLEAALFVPEGLTFVSGSIVSSDKSAFGWDGFETTSPEDTFDHSLMLNAYGSKSFEGTEKMFLYSFKCTVNNDAALKGYTVTLEDLVADTDTFETKNPTVVPATFTVEAKPVAVTGVTLTETAGLTEGENTTLVYEVLPADASNKSVAFKSSNNAVATVNAAGKVTAVKEGTATITVTTADGGFTDTCVVTVTKAPCTHTSKTATPAKTATVVSTLSCAVALYPVTIIIAIKTIFFISWFSLLQI